MTHSRSLPTNPLGIGSHSVLVMALMFALSFCPSNGTAKDDYTAAAVKGDLKEVRFSLIHAQNVEIEESMPICPDLRESLVKLFGYSRYRLIGEARSALRESQSVRFEPNSLFHLKLARVSQRPCRYEIELMQDDQSMVRALYYPKPEVPLIIRGPFYDKGNLVLVVRSVFHQE